VKALITGGAGFLGSHLAEALIARGDTVYVLDTLSTGSIENIEHLKTDRRFHYAIDSVTNEPVAAELIDRVDVVFHLAAAVGVRLIVESPVNTIETNVHGTEMVLKLATRRRRRSWSPPPPRSTEERRRPLPRGSRHRWGRRARAAGATPAARPSTSSWPWPTTRRSTSS
jgi:NAD(P)-dependent dehydrogenase (short-subunit alcohol dehydrogenase family)